MARAARRNVDKNKNKLANAVLLIVEGETEKNFFQQFKRQEGLNYNIIIKTDSTFKTIEELKRKHTKHKTVRGDKVYIVHDIEYSSEWLNKLTNYKNGYYEPKQNVFITNVSIEIFFLSCYEKIHNSNYDEKGLNSKIACHTGKTYVKGMNYNFIDIISNWTNSEKNCNGTKRLEDEHTNFSNIHELLHKLINK